MTPMFLEKDESEKLLSIPAGLAFHNFCNLCKYYHFIVSPSAFENFCLHERSQTNAMSKHFFSTLSYFDLLHLWHWTGINGSRSAILHRWGKCSSQVCLGRHHGLLGEIVFSIQKFYWKKSKKILYLVSQWKLFWIKTVCYFQTGFLAYLIHDAWK